MSSLGKVVTIMHINYFTLPLPSRDSAGGTFKASNSPLQLVM